MLTEVVQNQNITSGTGTGTQGCRPAEGTLSSKLNYFPYTHCTMCYCSQKAPSLTAFMQDNNLPITVSPKIRAPKVILLLVKTNFYTTMILVDRLSQSIYCPLISIAELKFKHHISIPTACPLPRYVPPVTQLTPH